MRLSAAAQLGPSLGEALFVAETITRLAPTRARKRSSGPRQAHVRNWGEFPSAAQSEVTSGPESDGHVRALPPGEALAPESGEDAPHAMNHRPTLRSALARDLVWCTLVVRGAEVVDRTPRSTTRLRTLRRMRISRLPPEHLLQRQVIAEADAILELLLEPNRSWLKERCRHENPGAGVLRLHAAEQLAHDRPCCERRTVSLGRPKACAPSRRFARRRRRHPRRPKLA